MSHQRSIVHPFLTPNEEDLEKNFLRNNCNCSIGEN